MSAKFSFKHWMNKNTANQTDFNLIILKFTKNFEKANRELNQLLKAKEKKKQ